MRKVLQIISFIGLLLTIVPPILYFNGKILQVQQNWFMILGALIWFISASFWMNKKNIKRNRSIQN